MISDFVWFASFLCGPGDIEVSEVMAYLPEVGSCKWVKDSSDRIVNALAETLDVLISKVALACGACGHCITRSTMHNLIFGFFTQVIHMFALILRWAMPNQRQGGSWLPTKLCMLK